MLLKFVVILNSGIQYIVSTNNYFQAILAFHDLAILNGRTRSGRTLQDLKGRSHLLLLGLMEDFVFPWDAPRRAQRPQAAASTHSLAPHPHPHPPRPHSKRRSSILKQKSLVPSPNSKEVPRERPALQDVNGRPLDAAAGGGQGQGQGQGQAAGGQDTKKKSRRSLKRVSFSASKQVKEFQTGSETLTVWNNTYEEEQHLSTSTSSSQGGVHSSSSSSSNSSSSSSNSQQQQQQQRKRSLLLPEGASDSEGPSSKKFHPLTVEIPSEDPSSGSWWPPHRFLPSGEGGHDLLKTEASSSSSSSAPNTLAFLNTLSSRRDEDVGGDNDDSNFLRELEIDNRIKTNLNTSMNRGATSRYEHLLNLSGPLRTATQTDRWVGGEIKKFRFVLCLIFLARFFFSQGGFQHFGLCA